jgi:hypothetical protein
MQDDQDLRARLEAALAQGQQLRDEVQQLKAILAQHSIPLPELKTREPVSTRYLPRPPKLRRLERLPTMSRKLPCSGPYSAVGKISTRSDGAPRMARGLIVLRARRIG